MATFSKSFAAARKAGKKEFTYEGKKYNTKLASDTPKKGPTPTSRQGADKGSGGRSTQTKASKDSTREKQGPKLSQEGATYPRAERRSGVAKPGSTMSTAVARRENSPKQNTAKPSFKEAMGIKLGKNNASYAERKKKK